MKKYISKVIGYGLWVTGVMLLVLLISRYPPIITPVFAHILKTDGTFGGVLHIVPDDDPIAGQETLITVELKDTSGKLKPQNCDCKLIITEDNKVIHEQDLFSAPNTDNSVVHPFTFPQKDIYQIKITGNPTTPGAFKTFNLIYDIRVTRESENKTSSQNNTDQPKQDGFTQWTTTHVPHIIGGVMVLAVFIFAILKQRQPVKTR